ncbi:MAG: UDP-N-acetylglucosamine--N-acetylmuramyl-(pentapeptide) pyrophosphoryl-undecaprenol N-acetylglucosamine transferase [Clostridiales bacterium]|jgi:UDP-N-acetylglucosamine--N-acetylmuramyl-(pentapeptide) pyrophosphoryl-undecaprenol N-acetylglucosamine transferase|nr:UDP-N-acetylglucosamine--N-acetylmuramyl-(pentapeptide) pyrophosphoryl-undecaprenol N-acetylglucosamine transferase [Clostridiales bacterium]
MTIVLTGGGTAGHITPNISLLPELRKLFGKIYYIGGGIKSGKETGDESESVGDGFYEKSGGLEKSFAKKYGVPFYPTAAVKFDRAKPLKNLKIPVVLPRAVAEAARILKELRPDVLYSKGGYAALPSALAAGALRIPVVAHESDMTLGAANKLCAPFCKRIFLSFENEKYAANRKYIHTGAPVREELFRYEKGAARRALGIPDGMRALLITGGSSGAQSINECVYKCLGALASLAYVLHLTGKTGNPGITGANYRQFGYVDEIGLFFAAADAVISRAGAATAAELFALNKKTLFIPLPKTVSRGDQILNAEYYSKKYGAAVLPQENMNEKTLPRYAAELLARPEPKPIAAFENPNKKIASLLYRIADKREV